MNKSIGVVRSNQDTSGDLNFALTLYAKFTISFQKMSLYQDFLFADHGLAWNNHYCFEMFS